MKDNEDYCLLGRNTMWSGMNILKELSPSISVAQTASQKQYCRSYHCPNFRYRFS
jgi:hypothetical protein